jgi:hypothetical protein
MGRSLKYFNTGTNTLKSNTLWKLHQNKNTPNVTSSPAHVVLTPTDNSNVLNFMNLDDIGISTVKDSTAFKKIQFFSKTDPTSLFSIKSDFTTSFNKLANLYTTDLNLNSSYTYGMDRQHNYTSVASTLPLFNTLMDRQGLNKFYSYNFNNLTQTKPNGNTLDVNRVTYDTLSNTKSIESLTYQYHKLLPQPTTTSTPLTTDFTLFLKIPNIPSIISAESDSKQQPNPFKLLLNFGHSKKLVFGFDSLVNELSLKNLGYANFTNNFSYEAYNTENLFKFKDLKSSNSQFLGSERTVRLLKNLNTGAHK